MLIVGRVSPPDASLAQSAEGKREWEFTYGQRAVLHDTSSQAAKVRSDEYTSDEWDENSDEDECESQGVDDVGQASPWHFDGQSLGKVKQAHNNGFDSDIDGREQASRCAEDYDHHLHIAQSLNKRSESEELKVEHVDKSDLEGAASVPNPSNSNGSCTGNSPKSGENRKPNVSMGNKASLQFREADNGHEYFLCGEWGHGKFWMPNGSFSPRI